MRGRFLRLRRLAAVLLLLSAGLAGGVASSLLADCGPFMDVSGPGGYCPFILQLYYLGITAGTSATTFSPDQPVTRGQAAVFVSKAIDTSIQRSSRRAALGQWWTTTPQYEIGLGTTLVGDNPVHATCDGADVWVSNTWDGTVSRVRASDGQLLATWSGMTNPTATLSALGRIFVASPQSSGTLYMLDPTQSPTTPTIVSGSITAPHDIAFDGARIWTANGVFSLYDGVSIVTPGPTLPWSVTTIAVALTAVGGILYDGSHIWVVGGGAIVRLSSVGAELQRVVLPGAGASTRPVFDGTNIWVPSGNSVYVIRASSGELLKTLTGNGLDSAIRASFDGERILIVNSSSDGSLWRAADLTPLGSVSFGPGTNSYGACSDGLNFWVTLRGTDQLARF